MLTKLTIWFALTCYTISLFTLRNGIRPQETSSNSNRSHYKNNEPARYPNIRLARLWLTIGLSLYVLHVLAAFHAHYNWSHEIAIEQTTKQTLEVTGLEVWIGLYVNYFFTFVWILEAALWWRVGDVSYSKSIGRIRFWFFHSLAIFLVANGGVIFVANWTRYLGLVMLVCQVILLVQIARLARTGDTGL